MFVFLYIFFFQELERKFNDTAAFVNMKNIITKKNEQVREMRDRLLVYEKEDNEENFVA